RNCASRASASLYSSAACDWAAAGRAVAINAAATKTTKALRKTRSARTKNAFVVKALSQLGIDFLEIATIDQHLARLAARTRRHEPLGFHHVDQARGATETNSQSMLQ